MNLNRVFPSLDWIRNYQKPWLSGDLISGLTVGVMLIPQGMAYALIAGLPPVYGLYASIVPQIIYALLGTSRQLAVGPVAMDSLLVAAGISLIATEGTDTYIGLAIALSLLVGVIQLLLGVFRMGFITNLLSRPVISGFTSAAAVIIGLNQLKHLLGVDIPRSADVWSHLVSVIDHIPETNLTALVIGLLGIILMTLLKRGNSKIPAGLLAVTLSILCVYLFNLDVSIIRDVPEGLPALIFPAFTMDHAIQLLPLAMTVAVVAYMEAFSVAKAMEAKSQDHKIQPNKELIGLGAANIFGSLFQSYPVTGGFSRTAVNFQSGAKTPLSAMVSAVVVAMALLFLTDLFYYLPHSILASIILVAVAGLVDITYGSYLWRTSKVEFILMNVTFVSTLLFGMVEGIASGIVFSILVLLYRSAYPHIAQLGRLETHHEYRNIKRFDNLISWPNLLILRVDAPLTFINIQYFKDYISDHLDKHKEVDTIILDAGPISQIDASAANGLTDLLQFLNKKNIRFLWCDLIGPVRDIFHRTGLIDHVDKRHIFLDLDEAVGYATDNREGKYGEYAIQSNVP